MRNRVSGLNNGNVIPIVKNSFQRSDCIASPNFKKDNQTVEAIIDDKFRNICVRGATKISVDAFMFHIASECKNNNITAYTINHRTADEVLNDPEICKNYMLTKYA